MIVDVSLSALKNKRDLQTHLVQEYKYSYTSSLRSGSSVLVEAVSDTQVDLWASAPAPESRLRCQAAVEDKLGL